jgi:hypothetical protein
MPQAGRLSIKPWTCNLTTPQQKKDPRLILPGFEVYAELKPIAPFWQWLLVGLIAILSPLAYTATVSTELWPNIILIFAILTVAASLALVYRRKSFPVAIKREGSVVLMAGRAVSETLSNSSKIELQNPTTVYLEKPGGRMQLRKMMIRFLSSEDARKVIEWLQQRPGATAASPENSLDQTGEIWALVYAGEYIKRSRIQFEHDVCYVVDPGRNIFDVKPKRLERRDEMTLVARTGFLNHGNIVMKFDSPSDAEKIEQRLKEQLNRSISDQTKHHREFDA